MPTAIEIYKLLPKTNCGECKFPTCLAFAMQLANKKVALDDCPYADDAAKATLAESGAPPMKLIKFGGSAGDLEVGDETEIYRHEKKFYHPTVLALSIRDSLSDDEQNAKIAHAKSLEFERVGQKIRLDAVALRNDSGDAGKIEAIAKRAMEGCNLPIILLGKNADALRQAVSICKDRRPILGTADRESLESMAALASEFNLPLILSAGTLEDLSQLSSEAKEKGVQDIVLDLSRASLKEQLTDLTIVRRMTVKSGFRPFGYPTLIGVDGGDDEVVLASLGISKYASIVVLESDAAEDIYPLMTFRQNIYTDPQVPLQVEEKLYEIGNPKPESPLLLTTNFSLTYFTVAGDIEKSGISSWLLVANTEGLSVMTAFAAGKLTPEGVGKLIEGIKVTEKCTSGSIIIPGMVSRMSGKLGELTGLKVIVGPRESSGLPKFLKNLPR